MEAGWHLEKVPLVPRYNLEMYNAITAIEKASSSIIILSIIAFSTSFHQFESNCRLSPMRK